jgi:imidazolonepropionase-like amidohydrolase
MFPRSVLNGKPTRETELQSQLIAFVGVDLVPMDKERVLRNQTVIVHQGKVVQIDDSTKVRVPQDAVSIDGRGKFLMPGLVDMHTHTWGEADFVLFIANGVTTIRNMWGSRRQLAWRERIAKGSLVGPIIYTAGPLIDGDPPIWNDSKVILTREEAEKEVALEKEMKYDFVKVYNNLSLEAYQAIVAAARKNGMRVVGHVPNAVGLDGVLRLKQDSIEHLQGYINAIQTDDSPVKGKFDLLSRGSAVDYVDEDKIPQAVAATVAANSWNCVTLIVYQKLVSAEDAKRLLADPRMRFVSPDWLASWDPTKDFRSKDMGPSDFDRIRKADVLRARLTRELHRAGARILLGTDTPNPFVIPGFSIHEELRNLVNAGLTPYEAIKAGTRSAAEFLGALDEFGTVEVGKRADLILVAANPLEDVGTIANPLGVMARGRWFSREELLRALNELAATYVVDEGRFDGHFHPFPHRGEDQLRSSYLFRSTDTLLGKERFVLQRFPQGGFLITSQLLVSAPPRIERFTIHLELSEAWVPASLSFEGETSEGTTSVSVKRIEGKMVMSGHRYDGSELEAIRDFAQGSILATRHVASYLPLVNRLQSLQVGQTLNLTLLRVVTDPELDFIDSRWQLERKSDGEVRGNDGGHGSVRVYGIKETQSNASYDETLSIDNLGRISLFEIVQQMGLTRHELIENQGSRHNPSS